MSIPNCPVCDGMAEFTAAKDVFRCFFCHTTYRERDVAPAEQKPGTSIETFPTATKNGQASAVIEGKEVPIHDTL